MAYRPPVSSDQHGLQGCPCFNHVSFMPQEGTAGSEILVTVQPSHDLSAMPIPTFSLSFQGRRVPLQMTSKAPSEQDVLFDFSTRVPVLEFLASDSPVPLDFVLADSLGRLQVMPIGHFLYRVGQYQYTAVYSGAPSDVEGSEGPSDSISNYVSVAIQGTFTAVC